MFFNTWKKQKQITKIKQSKKQKIRHFGYSISNNFGKFSFNKGFSSRTESWDSAEIQKQPPEVFFKKRCKAYKRLSHRCFRVNISKNSFFTEHLWATASGGYQRYLVFARMFVNSMSLYFEWVKVMNNRMVHGKAHDYKMSNRSSHQRCSMEKGVHRI